MDTLLQEFIPDRVRLTKLRLKASQKQSPVSIEWLADRLRHPLGEISPARLYQLLDPNHPTDRFNLDDLEIWITETGDFGPLDDIEARLGRVAYAQPRALESATEISLQGAQVFGHCAALCQTLAALAGPGEPEISWEQYKQWKKATRQLHKVLAVLQSSVRQQAARHPSWPRRLWERFKSRAGK